LFEEFTAQDEGREMTPSGQKISLNYTSSADTKTFVAFAVINGVEAAEAEETGHVRMCGAFED